MAGFGPIAGLQLTLALQVRPGEFNPGAGQQFSGQVVTRPEGLAIQTPQGSFNLPPDSGLLPGARVRVDVFLQQGKPAIRVTPVSPAASSPSPSAAPASVPPPTVPQLRTDTLPPADAPAPPRPFTAPRTLETAAPFPSPPPAAQSPTAQPQRAAEFFPNPTAGRPVAPSPVPSTPTITQPPSQPGATVQGAAQHASGSPAPSAVSPAQPTLAAETVAATNTAAAATRFAVFVPHAALHYPAVVSRLLQTVAAPAELNDDFGGLIRILAQVFGRSADLPEGAEGLQRWTLPDDMSEADALASVLKRNVESGLRTPEGALGRERTASQSSTAAESFRALVASFLNDDVALAALRDAGLVEEFSLGAERVLDKAAGGQLQNLRALDAPYAFAALPAMPGSGLRHAQLHIFGDGRGNGGEDAPIRVHLDLELTELGPMWIALNLHGAHCDCTIRSPEPEIRALVEAYHGELEEALRAAGYRNARCIAAPWHGDRLCELADALRAASPGWDADA